MLHFSPAGTDIFCDFPYHFMLGEMMFYSFNLHIRFMPLAQQDDHITRQSMGNGIGDGFSAVVDLNVRSIMLRQSHFNIVVYVFYFFKSRIITGQNTKIRK